MNRVYINNDCLGKYHGAIPAYFQYKGYKGYEYLTYGSPIGYDYKLHWTQVFKMFVWICVNKKIIKKISISHFYTQYSALDNYYYKDIIFLIKHLFKFKKEYLFEYC